MASSPQRPIGIFKVYVGPGLFDEGLPPAMVRMDSEAASDIHNGEAHAWCALLAICEQHAITLKNQIASE